MIKSLRKVYPVYIFLDLILITVIFYICYLFKYNSLRDILIEINLPNFKEYSFVFILWVMFTVISLKRRNLYSTDRALTIPKEISGVVISVFSTSILIGAIIFFAKYKFFSREVFLESFFLLCITLSGWRAVKRLILRKLISEGFHNINVLIVGAGKVGKVVLEEIERNPHWGFNVIGFLDDAKDGIIDNFPVLGKLENFTQIARKHFVDEAIITIPSERKTVAELIRQAKKMHLGLRIVPENFEEPLPTLNISYLGVIPLLTYKERRHHPAELALKRIFDFVVSLIALIVFFLLFLVIAVLIKLDSKGPVLYVQKRTGYKGSVFNFYKFRSMVQGADKLKQPLLEENEIRDGVIFKMRNDPRVTYVGRFLRRYSLDELPQLFNVLKGDLSLVGPRPPTPDEVEKYNYNHMQRLSIRPGITCLSQVRGRSELTFREWVKWDTWYINNWSFGLDLLILWWTIPAILKGKGAY